jgi:hypothetical protein
VRCKINVDEFEAFVVEKAIMAFVDYSGKTFGRLKND